MCLIESTDNHFRMELQQFTNVSFIITIFLFLIVLVKQIIKSRTQTLLPPGPSKLPFIGNLHQLIGHGLPHVALRHLAAIYGPIMSLRLGEVSAVVISSPETAKQIMATHDLMFADRASNLAIAILSSGHRDLIFASYGEYWRQLRKICILELLSPKRVQSFWSAREEEVSSLIDRISLNAGSPVNLSREFLALTIDITTRVAFGKACQNKEAFLSSLKEAIRMASGFAIHDLYPSLKFLEVFSGTKTKVEKVIRDTEKMLDDIIREHQMRSDEMLEENLVDVLLKVKEGRVLDVPISMHDVKAVLIDVFLAGTDTTSTAIEWIFSELLRNPKIMKKAQAEVRQVFGAKRQIEAADMNELHYLGLVIKETLRIHPPIPLTPRVCRERCEMGGYVIPKGTRVIINSWAIGRDVENWTDPERFEPERFQDNNTDYKGTNFKYIPFGAGRRGCPGISFGMANVEHALAHLLYHFDWEIAGGVKPEELDMTEKVGIAFGRKYDLYAIPTVCQPYE